jgi:uroporphyrin-III C-methyltransferase
MGRVVFIGAGPGTADLITVRGLRRLAEADVVLSDALVDPELQRCAPDAIWIDVGKRGFCDSTAQTRINALLVREARRHDVVVRLKGGDPSVFGRLEEELQALADESIESEVVPGVTAALAAAAEARRPLTRRGSGRSVALTTAMTRTGELEGRRGADTEVFYMGGRQLPALSRRLIEAGWPGETPAVVVSHAGHGDPIITEHTVASLAHGSVMHAGRPAVVTVGVGARPILRMPATRAAEQSEGDSASNRESVGL